MITNSAKNHRWATRNKNCYDERYFEYGKQSQYSGYENYQWQPERSRGEAEAFIRTMDLTPGATRVLDFGCAKGFFVRAMRERGFDAYGVDISDYARKHADPLVRDRLFDPLSNPYYYRAGYCKDTLEHIAYDDIDDALAWMANVCQWWMLVIPMADDDEYRIPDYEIDQTHALREAEDWWLHKIGQCWDIDMAALWVKGIKDKWFPVCPTGNLVIKTRPRDAR